MSDHQAKLEQKGELTAAAKIPLAKWDQYGLTEEKGLKSNLHHQ